MRQKNFNKARVFLPLILMLICVSTGLSQNIVNTIGNFGTFQIKDASNNLFLNMNQSTGYLNLNRSLTLVNTTSSSTGIIYKANKFFLHDYSPAGSYGYNVFLGIWAGNLSLSDQAMYNIGIGWEALGGLTDGSRNIAIGTGVLVQNTTGNFNTALGNFALNSIINTGSNTAIGYNTLFNSTGSSNTALGYNAGNTVTTGVNLTLIGNGSVPSSPTSTNQVTLGNFQVTQLRCAVTSITSLSDARDKKNIEDLSLGLDFLCKIRPRQFNWDKREWYDNSISDGSKMQETPTAGFIAQELDEAQTNENAEWLNLVSKDNPQKWEATYGNLLPVVIKAIQELKAENDKLRQEIEILKNMKENTGSLKNVQVKSPRDGAN